MNSVARLSNFQQYAQGYQKLGLALGPGAAIALVVWRAGHTSLSPFFYFPDALAAACINFWLAVRLVDSLWGGSASVPRVARWMGERAALGWPRLVIAARRWTVHTAWTTVAAYILARPLHAPLAAVDIGVFATGPASLVITFELSGWWLAHRSAHVRRVARVGLALALGVFLAAWLFWAQSQGLLGNSTQATLYSLVYGNAWNWFLPGRWTVDLLESLGNGGTFLGQLLPLLGCVTVASALYACLPLPRPASNPSPPPLTSAAAPGEDRV